MSGHWRLIITYHLEFFLAQKIFDLFRIPLFACKGLSETIRIGLSRVFQNIKNTLPLGVVGILFFCVLVHVQ